MIIPSSDLTHPRIYINMCIYLYIYMYTYTYLYIYTLPLPKEISLFHPIDYRMILSLHSSSAPARMDETCITCGRVIPSLSILTPKTGNSWGPGPLLHRFKPFYWRVQWSPQPQTDPQLSTHSWGFQPDCWVSALRCTQKCCAPAICCCMEISWNIPWAMTQGAHDFTWWPSLNRVKRNIFHKTRLVWNQRPTDNWKTSSPPLPRAESSLSTWGFADGHTTPNSNPKKPQPPNPQLFCFQKKQQIRLPGGLDLRPMGWWMM